MNFKVITFIFLSLLFACTQHQLYTPGTAIKKPLSAPGAARPEKAPEENRFSRIVLADQLDEPMELSVLHTGQVLFIERKGNLKLYDPKTNSTTLAGTLNVFAGNETYFENEDGLIGLAADPRFGANNFIYLYYAPAGPERVNRLSRFTLKAGRLELSSEKILLQVQVLRECCHSGGSLAFGPDGNLFLSLGDNTNPFEAGGYSPMDERAGPTEPWDAQRTAANSNDLRGKILRIHPEPDGSYSIPKGNLFPKGTPNTLPEIYIMGNRNPFRISVDAKTGYLYWGDVGADANQDSTGRGPRGHDEINQARQAGFFGWPYFVADNKAYWEYDFGKGLALQPFQAQAPVNNSPNNSGVSALPPAQKALIWYPNQPSPTFPLVGSGGRTALAGPVYYADSYPSSTIRFPAYYHGKLFIYEWMRNWIMAVTLDEQGNYKTMERFLPGTTFKRPIDMEFGQDGALYVLEYGSYWVAQNDDARLSRIEYHPGNRKPMARAAANKTAGAVPCTVVFSGLRSFDEDQKDSLRYEWSFDQPGVVQSRSINPRFTFTRPGIYHPTLRVRDASGEEAVARLEVRVGNEPPVVKIKMPGNKSFYWQAGTVAYSVAVSDQEDGSLRAGTISPADIRLTYQYIPRSGDLLPAAGGQTGKALLAQNDCLGCHAQAEGRPEVGPSFQAIARRYAAQAPALGLLATKIIKGGVGNWGKRKMPPHPQLSPAQARALAHYILTINKPAPALVRLSARGRLRLSPPASPQAGGTYLLQASYRDKGAPPVAGLTGQDQVLLRSPWLLAAEADAFRGAAKANNGLHRKVRFTRDNTYIMFRNLDLTGIYKLVLRVNPNKVSGKIELRLHSPTGRLIGSTPVVSQANRPFPAGSSKWFDTPAYVSPTTGLQDIYLVFRSSAAVDDQQAFLLDTIYFGQSGGTLAARLEEVQDWCRFHINFGYHLYQVLLSRCQQALAA